MNQVRRIIGLLLALVMLCSMVPAAFAETTSFADFPTGWSKEAMTAAVNNGLLNGYDDGKIHPEANLTRAQFAAIITRAFGAKTKADISGYTDVLTGAWYHDAIAKAVKMEALNGKSSTTMDPDAPITRQEVFTAFARVLVLSDNNTSALDKFNDKGEIASWAINHMAALTQRGYVNGDPQGNVNPTAFISREELAQLMHNSIRTYITKPGTYTNDLEGITVVRCGDVTLKALTNSSDLVIADGVGEGKIALESVIIGKRLLVRGGSVIKVSKSTLGDFVVVNNVNGVTKFDNYRSELFFKNIVENTEAKFQKTTSGGSIGGSNNEETVTVTFYNHYVNNPVLAKRKVTIRKGTTVDADEFPDETDYVRNGYVENSDIAPVYDSEWTHTIVPDFWYVKNGVMTPFDETVVVNEDTNVYLLSKSLSFILQLESGDSIQISADYNTDTRAMNSIKDMFAKSGRNQLNLALAQNLLPDYMDKVVNKMVAAGIIDNEKKVQIVDVPIKISMLIGEETINEMVKQFIRDSVKTSVDFAQLYTLLNISENADELGVTGMTEEQIKLYVNSLSSDEKQNFADELFEVVKRDTIYRYFVDSLMNDDTFEINKANTSQITIIKNSIRELTLEKALAESNNSAVDKLVDAIGIDAFRPYYESMRDSYCDAMETVIDEVLASSNPDIKKNYTTALTFKLNIFDIYTKLYDNAKDKVIEKLENAGINYNDNKYLEFLIEQDFIEYLFDGDESLADGDFTGYSLKSVMDYYDYFVMLLIVGDDALTEYASEGNLSDEQLVALYDAIFDKIFIVSEKLDEILEAFKEDGELPSKLQSAIKGLDTLNGLMLQFDDRARAILGRYIDSDINIWLEDGSVVTIDSIYELLYTYDSNVQEKLKSVIETDKFQQAIDKFESTPIGELFKGDAQSDSLYDMFYTLAYEGIDAFKVPAGELEVTDIDIYKIKVGKVEMTVQRSYK